VANKQLQRHRTTTALPTDAVAVAPPAADARRSWPLRQAQQVAVVNLGTAFWRLMGRTEHRQGCQHQQPLAPAAGWGTAGQQGRRQQRREGLGVTAAGQKPVAMAGAGAIQQRDHGGINLGQGWERNRPLWSAPGVSGDASQLNPPQGAGLS
jgi:hypothetical protein